MRPSLFATPHGVTFARAFARGFWRRYGTLEPHLLAEARIFVNTPRTGLRLLEALAAEAPGSRLLPRIAPLEAVGADPIDPPGLPPAVDPLRRHLVLVRLVEAYLRQTEGCPATEAAPALADTLARLMDELDEEAVCPSRLDTAVGDAHASHWSENLAFLDIARKAWPQIRREAEGDLPDPIIRRRAAVRALINRWVDEPPVAPVIAAGSTGSRLISAELMAAIASLPTGAVVLPGFDRELDSAIGALACEGRAPDHPHAPFARLLALAGATPADVRPWEEDGVCPPRARRRLFEEAMRPAPVTDAWRAALDDLAADAQEATRGLTLIEATNGREEAGAIAVALREAVSIPGRRAVLVTPDAVLARRVVAELSRYGIVPDDATGRPLDRSPAGTFLRLLLDLARDPPDPVRIAGLIGHPLARFGLGRRQHLAHARAYQLDVLRASFGADAPPGTLPDWPDATDEQTDWLARLRRAVDPLSATLAAGAPLGEVIAAHRAAAEAMAEPIAEDTETTADSGRGLWEGDDGAEILTALLRLEAAADAYGTDAGGKVYPALLNDLLAGLEIRPRPGESHPRVAIVGPREARAETADLFILGGLTDGTWPELPGPDPWLNRPMRAALGLPPQEARIGLSAHDFLHSALRPEVMLCQSATAEGAPTLPSRWLVRLVGLLGAVGDGQPLADMRARGHRLLALARQQQRPVHSVPPAPRPAPRPKARLAKLSVTGLERLIADAYAVYARHMLGLSLLEPLGRPPDYRDRGTVLHDVLRKFTEDPDLARQSPEQARAALLSLAERNLSESIGWPDRRRIWYHRLWRAADWFLAGEAARRSDGEPIAWEVSGALEIAAPRGPFTITAKADRIDLLTSGDGAIFDYKTGQPPTLASIKQGKVHQLHVQGAILATGGFEAVAPLVPARGGYIGLTGSAAGGSETVVADLAAGIPAHLENLARLIAAFDTGAPFTARGRPDFAAGEGDYDHLARRTEWEGA